MIRQLQLWLYSQTHRRTSSVRPLVMGRKAEEKEHLNVRKSSISPNHRHSLLPPTTCTTADMSTRLRLDGIRAYLLLFFILSERAMSLLPGFARDHLLLDLPLPLHLFLLDSRFHIPLCLPLRSRPFLRKRYLILTHGLRLDLLRRRNAGAFPRLRLGCHLGLG